MTGKFFFEIKFDFKVGGLKYCATFFFRTKKSGYKEKLLVEAKSLLVS